MAFLVPSKLYTPADVASFLKVSRGTVYQSLPGATCRTKLGRKLPEPIRFGRLLRWSGQQINDFVGQPAALAQIPDSRTLETEATKRKPGRPRKNVVTVRGAS